MPMPPVPADPAAEARWEEVATALVRYAGVTRGQAFGMPCVKRGGKIFAGYQGGEMSFKLGAGTAEHGAAMGLPGAHPFDPSGMNRPFKDWVTVPVAAADQWLALAEVALGRSE